MIQIVTGATVPAGSEPDTVFHNGKVLAVRVIGSKGSRAEISVLGKTFTVLTKTPLEKGAELFVRVFRDKNVIELKILQKPVSRAAYSFNSLQEFLSSDPVLTKALVRSGVPLKEFRLNRLKRILEEKGRKDDPEYARLASLMEEKGLTGLVDPDFLLFNGDSDEKSGSDYREEWKQLNIDTAAVRQLLLRRSDFPTDLSIFNHTRSSQKYNWLVLPVRIKFEETAYKGDIRLCVELSAKKVSQGVLTLCSENPENPEEWCFGISDVKEKKMYLLKGPAVDAEKLGKFREKVRKEGFVFVDTNNRGAGDGFTPEYSDVHTGIDTEV